MAATFNVTFITLIEPFEVFSLLALNIFSQSNPVSSQMCKDQSHVRKRLWWLNCMGNSIESIPSSCNKQYQLSFIKRLGKHCLFTVLEGLLLATAAQAPCSCICYFWVCVGKARCLELGTALEVADVFCTAVRTSQQQVTLDSDITGWLCSQWFVILPAFIHSGWWFFMSSVCCRLCCRNLFTSEDGVCRCGLNLNKVKLTFFVRGKEGKNRASQVF